MWHELDIDTIDQPVTVFCFMCVTSILSLCDDGVDVSFRIDI